MVRLQVPPSPRTRLGSSSPMLSAKAEPVTKVDDDTNSLPKPNSSADMPHAEVPDTIILNSTGSNARPQAAAPQKPLHLMSLSEAALLRTSSRKSRAAVGGNHENGKEEASTLKTPMHAISLATSGVSIAEAAGQQGRNAGAHGAFTPSFHTETARRAPVERPQWSSRSAREPSRDMQMQGERVSIRSG
jgi:hypothetical protein